MLSVAPLFFLHHMQLLMKFLSENQQLYANLFLGLMVVNWNLTLCVNRYRPDFVLVGISIEKPEYSHLVKTRPVALKNCSIFFFNEQDQIAKLKASVHQSKRRKLTITVLITLVHSATLCSKQWVASINFVPIKKYDHVSLKKISNAVVKREKLLKLEETKNRKKVSQSLRRGSVSDKIQDNQKCWTTYPEKLP